VSTPRVSYTPYVVNKYPWGTFPGANLIPIYIQSPLSPLSPPPFSLFPAATTDPFAKPLSPLEDPSSIFSLQWWNNWPIGINFEASGGGNLGDPLEYDYTLRVIIGSQQEPEPGPIPPIILP